MLTLTHVAKRFTTPEGHVQVLDGASFSLQPGQTAALLGESGSGKSTLLHLIAGLDTPDSGSISVCGEVTDNYTAAQWNRLRRQTLSLVFQQYHLIPTLNVLDNIRLQARLAGRLDAELQHRLVDALGLATLLRRMPHQLSGGQQQRVAIARALMHQPKLVLADEPTGNLDEGSSEAVLDLLVQLSRETGSSLLMVTHSNAMARHLDSRWRLHQGHIVAADDAHQ